MVTIIYKVDPVKRTIKPMSVYAIAEQDHRADTIRFAFPDSIDPTAEGTIVRVMYIRPDGGDPVAKTLTFYKHSGGYYLYDWTLQKSDLQECGCLVFSLCVLTVSEGVVSEEWHTAPYSLDVLHSIHTDDSDEADETITPTVAQRVAILESIIHRAASGAPVVVDSASDMTDTGKLYVLSTDGYWYYHNGSAWVSGGEYGAVATDTTLSQSGIPADAEAVGDAIESFLANSMPSIIKTTIIALLKNAVYAAPNQANNIKKLDKWANGLPIISDSEDWTSGVPYTLNRIANEGATNQSGEIVASNRYDRTDYGYCKDADYLYIPNEYNGSWAGAWFYDDEKNYITPKIAVGTYAAVPENATYFVFYKDHATFDTVANDIIPFDASDFEVGWNRGVPYSGLTLFPNQSLTYATGIVKNSSNWSRTYYVNCDGVGYLKIPAAELYEGNDAYLYNWFYDEDKNPLSRFIVSKTDENYIMVPENAKYFILTFNTPCLEDIVEKGIVPYMTEDVEQ